MNIIIDARMVDQKLHGIARYTYELINGLSKKEDIKMKLLTNDIALSKKIFGEHDNLTFIKLRSKFLSPFEIFELPIRLNKYKKNYIYHSPSFSASPFIKLKSYITIHDLNHLALPQYYSKFHKYYYKFAVKPFALRCEKIFTVSEFSKNEIVRWLKCESDKIVVTYNGIDSKFRIIENEEILCDVKKKYKLPDKFILYIGNLKPHKNVEALVKAMKNVEDDIKLIINGKSNYELSNIINKFKLESKVDFIGYVDEEDLPVIYNLASVFVFPSLYEGFGLPPLEAMACGCKTIVSTSSCLPEVVGDDVDKFECSDIKKLTHLINKNINNYNFNPIIYEKVVNKFKWDNTVNKTFMEIKNS